MPLLRLALAANWCKIVENCRYVGRDLETNNPVNSVLEMSVDWLEFVIQKMKSPASINVVWTSVESEVVSFLKLLRYRGSFVGTANSPINYPVLALQKKYDSCHTHRSNRRTFIKVYG